MPPTDGIGELLKALEGLTRALELRSDTCSVVVSEYGGRVLGVFFEDEPNALWVSEDPSGTIRSGGWNIGGNRLWVSPERNFYYRNPVAFESWFCPSSLDPGAWSAIESGEKSVTLNNDLELEDLLNGRRFGLSLSRRITLVEDGKREGGLDHVVLRLKDALLVKDLVPGGINLWSLTQVRPPRVGAGTVVVPTRQKAVPVHYFGAIPKNRLKVTRGHIAFRIDGLEVHKLGVRPEDMRCTGCSSIHYYFEPKKGRAFLISMSTSMAPADQDECLDVAKADPNGPRGCVQSYNSGPDQAFGEIELHFRPALRVGGHMVSYADYEIKVATGGRASVRRELARSAGVRKPLLF